MKQYNAKKKTGPPGIQHSHAFLSLSRHSLYLVNDTQEKQGLELEV